MDLTIHLAQGTIDRNTQPVVFDDEPRVYNLTDKNTWSLKKLNAVDKINLNHQYAPVLDLLPKIIKHNALAE